MKGLAQLSVKTLRRLLSRRLLVEKMTPLLKKRAAVEKAIRRLDEMVAKLMGERFEEGSPRLGIPVTHKRSFKMSPAHRREVIAGQKRRWAAYHKKNGKK
jgi:hypothetical protein